MYLQSGTLLQGGKYKIVRFIKSGGFGCTYEAWNTVFEERVAIKEFFPKDFCNREDDTLHVTVGTQSKKPLVSKLRKKFIDEAKAIRKLPHPGIVTVSDVFEENGTAYYVMDYIDGCSLDDLVKREGTLSEQNALGYIRQVCEALSYVHSQKRLHLDIKPGNIMLDGSGRAILIDFGASKQYDEENGENTSTMLGLTPGYAPAEQYIRGGVSHFEAATDIYSLGATLYMILSGLRPVDAIARASGEPLLPLPESVGSSTRDAVHSSMNMDKMQRPQSVRDFLALLEVASDKESSPSDTARTGSEHLQTPSDDTTEIVEAGSSSAAKAYYRDNILVVNGVEYPMVNVRGGEFVMGDGGIFSDNRRHSVIVDDFAIGKYEVTQELWETVMGGNPSKFKGPRLPVEMVSWEDCQVFIRKLNELTGAGFRLPTEAEWEFAARGGKRSLCYEYSGSGSLEEVAWYSGNSEDQTHNVGLKSPNELGLYDMSGNVWEWCSDWRDRYRISSTTNPKGPDSGTYRVDRGGSWNCAAWCCRVSIRDYAVPDCRLSSLGLRLCL